MWVVCAVFVVVAAIRFWCYKNRNKQKHNANCKWFNNRKTYNSDLSEPMLSTDEYTPTWTSTSSDVEQLTLYLENPLVVMIGIGEYEHERYPNLEGVVHDCTDIIDVFSNYWGYHVLYQTNSNQHNNINNVAYDKETVELTTIAQGNVSNPNTTGNDENAKICYETNVSNTANDDKNEITQSHFKCHWTTIEIDQFLGKVEEYLVDNKHDGLIFVVASHGESGGAIVDSKGKRYNLDKIYTKFDKIPAIYIIDACRGTKSGRVTRNNSENADTINAQSVNGRNRENKDHDDAENDDDEKIQNTYHNGRKKSFLERIGQRITLYATVEGLAVLEDKNGGYLIRNVTEVFKQVENIQNESLMEIFRKIRKKTAAIGSFVGQIPQAEKRANSPIKLKPKPKQH